MRRVLIAFCLITFCKAAAFASDPARFLNRIEGQIFSESRTPIGDMYVELQSDMGPSLKTVRSSSLGRFTFTNVQDGKYRVRVLSSGKNFLEQSQDVEFRPSMLGRSDDTRFIEFYLRVDKRTTSATPLNSPEAVFVQEVPEEAQKLYRTAVDSLSRGDESGLATLESAIKTFPSYFEALSRLGKEYVLRKQYEKAYPLLLRAIDVNSRSFLAYYFLSWSFYKMDEIPAAIKGARACTVLVPTSVEAHVLLGTVLRIHGDFTDAEKALKKAISLSDGKDAQSHWQMALLLNRMNRNREAADELEAFLKLKPPDDADKRSAEELVAKLRAAKKT